MNELKVRKTTNDVLTPDTMKDRQSYPQKETDAMRGTGRGEESEARQPYYIRYMKTLDEVLTEKKNKSKLCKRGRDYIAARKRAGEKSSAYLSGRAVKVCKGSIKGSKGKRKKSYKENIDPMAQKKHKGNSAPYGSAYEKVKESLRDWFKKEDWVRINTSGNISGKCGTMKKNKPTTRCLPRAKAQSLTKAERKATVAKKVRGSKKGKQFVKNTSKAKFKKK